MDCSECFAWPDLVRRGVADIEQLAPQRKDAIVVATYDCKAGHGQCLHSIEMGHAY